MLSNLPSVNVGSLTTKHCHPFVAPFGACVPVLEGIYTNLIFCRKLGIPNTENTENAKNSYALVEHRDRFSKTVLLIC